MRTIRKAGPVLSRVRGDRGAAAVELALILPVLLLIIFGIIDMGRMLNAQITTNQAAREGARVAMLAGDDPAIDVHVEDRVDWATNAPDLAEATDILACPADPDRDDDAQVVVTYDFTFVTPLGVIIGFAAADEVVELTGRGVMPCRG
jgi:Flp pilus assembly protein TadG